MEVSNPNKVLFPGDEASGRAAVTKAEVVAHVERVASSMLGFVSGRPLTLQRFPRGIDAKGFMQKNAAEHFPDSIARLSVPKRGGGDTLYPVVDRAEDLAYLANQNTITFHMWTSSAERPGHPDWLILDLDPEAGDLDGVRVATRAVHTLLESFGLASFVLATGSKGFHVWVPIDGSAGFGDVSLVARALAGLAVAARPDELTVEFLKKNRRGRVFVDWLRNAPTATVVVPFSLRPRPGAPVAVPIGWDELAEARPDGWTIGSLGDRLDVDLAIADRPQVLPVERIVEAARAAGVDLDTPHDRFGRNR